MNGYSVEHVTSAEEGLSYAQNDEYDIIILDRMLPGGRDGLEICRELRRQLWSHSYVGRRLVMDDKVKGLKKMARMII